ncbi:MAG TPA: glycogen-binding domain-containing protein, partial [Gemmatimonadales bacterium]|nr:glycogen-binding domain-containing protein [Gemmatimonadales bacterium]
VLLRGAGEAHPENRSWQGFLTGAGVARGGAMRWRQAVGGEVGLRVSEGVWEGGVAWSRSGLLAETSGGWTEWTAFAGADLGGVRAGGSLGHRAGPGAGAWGSVSLAVPVGAATMLTGGLGSAPADPLTGRAGGRFATVGVQLGLGGGAASRSKPAPPPPIPAGAVRLALRAEPGATVELLGDWNGWAPLRLVEESPGHFAGEIVLEPGIYRFAFRVDGRWTLPPGQETEKSEYGGRRAVLRVGVS